jgi:ribosomal protein L7/L12
VIIYAAILIQTSIILVFHIPLLRVLARIRALSRVETKLDLLLNHAGIEYEPFKFLPPDVVDALQRGKKIEAIKRYRERTGAGLKKAKDVIEEVQRKTGV